MIFAETSPDGETHIEQIRKGIKTQTRRRNRGIYQIGHSYSVQKGRGIKGEPDIRIVMEKIWEEIHLQGDLISEKDALKEGGYTPEQYEETYQKINPHLEGGKRFGFEFHGIKICVECGKEKVPGHIIINANPFSISEYLSTVEIAEKENLCFDCALKKVQGGQ